MESAAMVEVSRWLAARSRLNVPTHTNAAAQDW
ncbi:Uncharacterised protein [Mycobacteroides abscessus subsp. abscessus]|nr:Uncharacterised protein [Mycobacteroides abscessus subsp. abscessus]